VTTDTITALNIYFLFVAAVGLGMFYLWRN